MTAEIFAYKGNLAASINMDGKFLNNPSEQGQLGCVIAADHVKISPDAVALIKGARREGGSFAELMLTKHNDGSGSSIGIMGFGKVHFGTKFNISRDCDLSVLDSCVVEEIEAPEDYKNFIDKATKPDVEEETEEEIEEVVETSEGTEPLKNTKIADRVISMIADKLGVDRSAVTPEANFTNDLGADSLDIIELIMDFEKEFRININDDQAEKLTTVGSVVEFVEANTK